MGAVKTREMSETETGEEMGRAIEALRATDVTLDQFREVLRQLEPLALRASHAAQYVTLFSLVNGHGSRLIANLSDAETLQVGRFHACAQEEQVVEAVVDALLQVDDWGRDLPALSHGLIVTLFRENRHPELVQRLFAAHSGRGYQSFTLECDLKWADAGRYRALQASCEPGTKFIGLAT